jgi:hypothetical protein
MEAKRKREQEIAEKLEAQRLEDEEARRRRSEELEKPLEAPPGLLSRGGRDMSHTNDADKPSSRKTVSAEASCKAWLVEAMAGDSRPTKSKLEYLGEALHKFSELSTRGFERAWSNAIAETGNANWAKPGRKSWRRIDTAI